VRGEKQDAGARWALLGLGVLGVAAAFWAKAHSPGTAYLDGPGWIVPGLVKNAGEFARVPTRVTFVRAVAGPIAHPVLEVRAMGAFEVALDGSVVQPSAWDAPHVTRDLTRIALPALAGGTHALEVTVRAPAGPVALDARLFNAGEVLLRTDASWSYEINGSSRAPARPARDPWIGAAYDTDAREPVAVWGKPWLTWGAAAASLVALALARRRSARPLPALWIAGGLAAVWVLLLAIAAKDVTAWSGFDREGHLEYLDWIRTRGTLPYPTDGWQMYQPPLYYLLAARVPIVALNGALAVGFLVAGALAIGRFVGRREPSWSLGVLLLGTTPMAFYLFAYPTNENLCTLMAALVFLALGGLRGRRIESLRAAAGVGLLLGAALLSKVSAVLLVVPVGTAYLLRGAAQLRAGHRSAAWRALGRLGAVLAAASLVSGWFFARTFARFGKPIVGNWDAASGQEWWQLPGFQTLGSYLPDLGLFRRPFFAGLDSVWSGFLASWAGDALLGGNAHVDNRPPWNYELTPVSIGLCLVVAVLVVIGVLSRLRLRSLRMPRLDACLLATIVVTVLTLLWMTLTVPAHAQAKAFYGLVAIVPLLVFAARGAKRVGMRSVVPFAAPWLVVFAGTFLVLPRADNLTLRALALNRDDRRGEAIATLERALSESPDDMNARVMLATLLLDDPSQEARVRELIRADRLEPSPTLSRRLDLLAQLERRAGRPDEAARLSRRAIALAPGRPRFWIHGIEALEAAGDTTGAAELRCEAMRWHPWGLEP